MTMQIERGFDVRRRPCVPGFHAHRYNQDGQGLRGANELLLARARGKCGGVGTVRVRREGRGRRLPGPPRCSSPPNATPDVAVAPQLQWNPAPAAASYRLQLSTAGDFSTLVLDTSGISLPQAVTPTLQNYKIYFWRTRGINAFGAGNWSQAFRFRTVQATGVAPEGQLPAEFRLDQNYPNPFNPSTTISFALPAARHVTLIVYDMLGREVERLVDELLPAGFHSAVWNASRYSSGVYIYRIQAGENHAVGRMILLK